MNAKQRIILVDDYPDDRELFAEAFDALKLQAELLLCEDGSDFLKKLDRLDQSVSTLIFLDLNMPVISGIEVLKKLRNSLGLDKIFVAIYSTSTSEADIENAYMNGAHGYISKPSSFGKLTALLGKTLKIATSNSFKPLPKDRFLLNND